MKCILLAAGYATRLYPLTENFPKPLLNVKDKTIVDWLIEDLDKNGLVDEVILVSNHKFITQFIEWKESKKEYRVTITVIDDGSTSNENRLGAVKDIAYAIEQCNLKERLNDGLLVMAGDNLLDFSIKGFIEFYNEKKATCIMRYYEECVDKLKRTGVVFIDEKSKVLEMSEKPIDPKSNWAVPPLYIYTKEDLDIIIDCVNRNEINLDAPGGFIEWFCKQRDVYAYEMPGARYDIGDKISLEFIRNSYTYKY